MVKSTVLRAVNSLEFIGIAVMIAVILTTLAFSAKAERDPLVKLESLSYSHLVNVQSQPQLPVQDDR